MPLRNSEEFRPQVQDTREYKHSGVVAADTNVKADVSLDSGRSVSLTDRILGDVLGDARNKLYQMQDIRLHNRYLAGQAKAGIIESEDEIQGNPMTRDWELAGYRDTMGKLALADMEAQFQADLGDIRAMGKQQFLEYIEKRRQDFLPAMASMSGESRAAAAGQLLMRDRADTQTWKTEHAKYIIEQKSAAVTTQWSTALRSLHSAQTQYALGELPKEALDTQIHNAVGTLFTSVWSDGSLPRQVQQSLTAQAMNMALSNDSVELYDALASIELPDGLGGAQSSLFSRLDGKTQDSLAEQYRSAMLRTKDTRNLLHAEQIGRLEAQLASGTYQGTYNSLLEFLNPLVVRGAMSGEKRENIIQRFLTEKKREEDVTSLGAAMVRGDLQALYSIGKTPADGIKAVKQMMAKAGYTPAQRLDTMFTIASNGFDEGYKEIGEQLSVSLRQMRNGKGEILPQHLEVFESINQRLAGLQDAGRDNARAHILSGLGDTDRMFAERIFKQVEAGKSFDEAFTQALATEAKEQALSPAVRAAMTAESAKAASQAVQDFDDQNIFQWAWGNVKSMFSSEAAADLELRPYSEFSNRDGWFSSSKSVQQQVHHVREALAEEVSNVLLVSPHATQDEAMSTAKANVLARTIKTDYGPLVLPRGTSTQALWGINGGNISGLGKAISSIVQPATDNSVRFAFSEGRLVVQEITPDDIPVGQSRVLEGPEIRAAMHKLGEAERKQANAVFGAGVALKDPSGNSVVVNGANTAGIQGDWMLGFRRNLVWHEGIRDTPYPDGKGHSVGIGVNSINAAYPEIGPNGKISQEAIKESFLKASNVAAKSGAAYMDEYGLDGVAAFQLTAELSYQSGNGFARVQTPSGRAARAMLVSIRRGQPERAVEFFKRTAAYQASGDTRRESYINLIKRAAEGG